MVAPTSQPSDAERGPGAPPAGARHVLANAGWLYLDQIVRSAVALVTFGLVARALGPAGFGNLSYALAFPGMFLPVASLGLDFLLVREFVRRPGEQAIVFQTGAWLKLFGSLTAFAACAAAGLWLVPDGTPAKPLLLITTFSLLLQPSTIIDCFFQSRIASKYPALARMGGSLVASGVRVWLVLAAAPLLWFAWAYVLEAVLLAAGLIIAFQLEGGRIPLRPGAFDRSFARLLLAGSWPLFLADVAIALYLRFNQVLLEHLAGAEELGRYAAATRLGDALEFFPLAIIASYFPHLVALHHEGKEDFVARLRQFQAAMTWFTVLIAAGVTIAGPWLVGAVLGARFAGSTHLLVIIAWANVFATQIAVRGRWFLAESWQLYTFYFFGLGAIAHLALLFWLGPRLGAEGAALAYLIAQSAMALLLPFGWRKTRLAGRISWGSFIHLKFRSH